MSNNVVDMGDYQTSGGGGSGGGMEPRVAKLEADVGTIKENVTEIKSDLRNVLYGLMGVFVLLGGMIIGAYLLLDRSIDKVADQVIELRVDN